MPPSLTDLYGPLDPVPIDQLVPDDAIRKALDVPGSPFNTQQRLIQGRLQTIYADLPASLRDFWMTMAKLYAHRDYIAFADECFTYAQVYQQSVQVAAWLRESFQVRKGDRVGIAARNYPEFVVCYWGCALAGAVACPLNSFHDGDTLTFSIRDVSCRVVIVDGERYERLLAHMDTLFDANHNPKGSEASKTSLTPQTMSSSSARATTGIVPQTPVEAVVVMPRIGTKTVKNAVDKPWCNPDAPKRVFDYDELMMRASSVTDAPPVEVLPEDHATILFTSGTTGKPKGVLSTQRQALACLRIATYGAARNLLRRKRALPPPPDPTSNDQNFILLLVPLMHTTGLHSGLKLATAAGNKFWLMPSYSRDAAVKIIQKEKIKAILGIGFMAREIVLSGADMPSLELVSHGGSAAAKELPSEVRSKIPKGTTGVGYGLTEVNGAATQNGVDDYYHKPTSAGKAPPGVELVIVDPTTGQQVKQGELGELWIRTPGRALGYWNRPEDTAAAFLDDGWFRTGDLSRFDEDGFVYIVDRVKDIIVRGGENISCTQVETAVYGHPSVLHCVAVAIPDERLTEKVGIVCVPHADAKDVPSEREIIEAASKTLPRYAVPEYVWVRRQDLDRNQSGKVLRNVVRQAFIEQLKERKATGTSSNERHARL